MPKYIITDPCYILDRETWGKCCDAAKMPSGEWNDEVFNAHVADALKVLTDSAAYACQTGFGDWTNRIYGSNVLYPEFVADSGMVCVAEFNDKVENSLKTKYPTSKFLKNGLAALIECEGDIKVEFDTEDINWTVVYIKDSKGNWFESMQPECEEDYE